MLKLRGLPFSASAQDIANWFNTGGNGMFNLSQESCAPRPAPLSSWFPSRTARRNDLIVLKEDQNLFSGYLPVASVGGAGSIREGSGLLGRLQA